MIDTANYSSPKTKARNGFKSHIIRLLQWDINLKFKPPERLVDPEIVVGSGYHIVPEKGTPLEVKLSHVDPEELVGRFLDE